MVPSTVAQKVKKHGGDGFRTQDTTGAPPLVHAQHSTRAGRKTTANEQEHWSDCRTQAMPRESQTPVAVLTRGQRGQHTR